MTIDSHVDGEGHYDAVPDALVKPQRDVRVTSAVVELFQKTTRVARPRRSALTGRHSTVTAPMPTAHQH